MGSWNETCYLSHLQILDNDNVKVMLVVQNKPDVRTCYIADSYVPLCLPFSGKYNEYGTLNDIIISDYTVEFLSKLKMTIIEKDEESKEIETKYQFVDIYTLLKDLEREKDIYVYKYDNSGKSKLTYIYYHEELYNILVEDFKTREVYGHNETYYELLCQKYEKVKNMILRYLELKKIEDKNDDAFDEIFKLTDDIRNNLYSDNGYNYKFPFWCLMKKVLTEDNIDDFIKEYMDYILFNKSLSKGRYGYYCISGAGGQDREVRVQRLIAKFILEFSERKYDYEEEEDEQEEEYDDEHIYSQNETIFWI